jgi:hypothetical protein
VRSLKVLRLPVDSTHFTSHREIIEESGNLIEPARDCVSWRFYCLLRELLRPLDRFTAFLESALKYFAFRTSRDASITYCFSHPHRLHSVGEMFIVAAELGQRQHSEGALYDRPNCNKMINLFVKYKHTNSLSCLTQKKRAKAEKKFRQPARMRSGQTLGPSEAIKSKKSFLGPRAAAAGRRNSVFFLKCVIVIVKKH